MPGSVKARLVTAAMDIFCREGYEGANVGDLAAAAGVTTGAIYHHFGSKLGLYSVIRTELERRLTDRMEGAAEAALARSAPPQRAPDGRGRLHQAIGAALLVAFDAALRFHAARLLSEPDPRTEDDAVAASLARMIETASPGDDADVVAAIVASAWRAALRVAAGGREAEARAALMTLF